MSAASLVIFNLESVPSLSLGFLTSIPPIWCSIPQSGSVCGFLVSRLEYTLSRSGAVSFSVPYTWRHVMSVGSTTGSSLWLRVGLSGFPLESSHFPPWN